MSSVCSSLLFDYAGRPGITNNQKEKKAEKSTAVETEHEEEEGKVPTDHKALSGNGERRSSQGAVAVQTPDLDEASAVQGKALPMVTGIADNFAPKCNNASKNLDGMISNEASGHECNGSSNEPESNDETPVSASAGLGDNKVLLSNRNRGLDQGTI